MSISMNLDLMGNKVLSKVIRKTKLIVTLLDSEILDMQ